MTSFQIAVLFISGFGLFGGILAVYIKTQIDIAKIQTSIKFLQRDLDVKESSILKLEKDNREDHQIILTKIDVLIDKIK